jgi:predicted aldo/keto reductase-like oxidoreductase
MDFSVTSNLEYTPAEEQLLANVSLKASLEFCQQCGECVPSCPHNVDIPTLMRTHMYARQYRNSYQARVTLAEVPKGSGLDVCRSCTSCRASCANTVNIARKISELKTVQLA